MLADNSTWRICILACVGVTAFLLVTASAAGSGEGRQPAFQYSRRTVHQPGWKMPSEAHPEAVRTAPSKASARIPAPNQLATTSRGNQERQSPDTLAVQEKAAGSPISKSPEKATATPYMPPDFGKQADFSALLSRVLVATLGVLIACCASIWLAKRFLTQSLAKPNTNSSLKLLATLPVSRRGCVQLVQADDTKLVVTIDGGALKSVIPLTESFGKTLFDSSEDPDVEIARKRNANEKAG